MKRITITHVKAAVWFCMFIAMLSLLFAKLYWPAIIPALFAFDRWTKNTDKIHEQKKSSDDVAL